MRTSSSLSKIFFHAILDATGALRGFRLSLAGVVFLFGQALFVLLLARIADDTPRTTGWNGVLDTMMRVLGDIQRLGISLICA